MKRLLYMSALAVLAVGSSIAIKAYAAASCSSCTVTDLYVDPNGFVWIGLNAGMAVASCASTWPTYLIFDPAGTSGTAYLSMAQTAFLTGAAVNVSGTNGAGNTPCTINGIYTGAERLSSLHVIP